MLVRGARNRMTRYRAGKEKKQENQQQTRQIKLDAGLQHESREDQDRTERVGNSCRMTPSIEIRESQQAYAAHQAKEQTTADASPAQNVDHRIHHSLSAGDD